MRIAIAYAQCAAAGNALAGRARVDSDYNELIGSCNIANSGRCDSLAPLLKAVFMGLGGSL